MLIGIWFWFVSHFSEVKNIMTLSLLCNFITSAKPFYPSFLLLFLLVWLDRWSGTTDCFSTLGNNKAQGAILAFNKQKSTTDDCISPLSTHFTKPGGIPLRDGRTVCTQGVGMVNTVRVYSRQTGAQVSLLSLATDINVNAELMVSPQAAFQLPIKLSLFTHTYKPFVNCECGMGRTV